MKTFILILVTLGSYLATFSQTDSAFKKNEFALNTLPLLIGAAGGSPGLSNFNLLYRRNFDKKWSFRLGVGAVLRNTYNYYAYNYNLLSYTDSTQIREFYTSHNKPEVRVTVGAEYNWGKRKVTWYTGADIFAGHFKKQDLNYTFLFELDSATATGAGPQWEMDFDSYAITEWTDSRNYTFGISPFIGFKAPLGKRFGVSVQSGLNFFFMYTSADRIYPDPQTDATYVSYNFELPGLINEVSLRYRF